MLVLCFAGMTPGFGIAFMASGDSWWSNLAVFAGIILAISGSCGGIYCWACISARKDGSPQFPNRTRVEIDERGLSIESFGLIPWRDIHAVERIPDSDGYLLAHTNPWSFLLDDDADVLSEVFSYFLNARHGNAANNAVRRASVFSYPGFLAWIVSGYLVAIGSAPFLLMTSGDGFFKTLSAVLFIPCMLAVLIWYIPLGALGISSTRRIRTFIKAGTNLRSTDGLLDIALPEARCRARRAKGLLYDFDFVTIRAGNGQTVHLLPAEGDASAFVSWLTGTPADPPLKALEETEPAAGFRS